MKAPYFLACCLSIVVSASIDDQTGANIDYGTFSNPSSVVRPRFRYWLPDAGVDKDIVKENIQSVGTIGAGGVEFLPFYGYGGETMGAPVGVNWSTNGFGTPAFNDMFEVALTAHKEAGLKMDFPLGPNQGQGVPASTDNEGLQWDLAPFSIQVPSNGSFDGLIPEWGYGELVALVSARVLSSTERSRPSASWNGQVTNTTWSELVLETSSLIDITSNVSANGIAQLSFPAEADDTHYRLFAFYQKLTLHKNLHFETNRTINIWDNGSYAVDHFSAKGAKVLTDFWEEYILTDNIRSLISEVGNYAWEDSVEALSNISWTPSLPEDFLQKHGYSIKPFLPLLIFENNNLALQTSDPGKFDCSLNSEDRGAGYVNDYRNVLADKYHEYLSGVTSWVNNVLGIQYSAQTSYNLPMDMLNSIPYVNAPECESLNFKNNLDAYREFTGVANLVGKRVISNEMGAEGAQAFRYTIPALLNSIHTAFAAGINQVVLHGQQYTGDYPNTTWPGYNSFNYFVSEMYSDKQPAWEHGFDDALNYVARLQHALQQGVPRTDLVVLDKQSFTNPNFDSVVYNETVLKSLGWTYNYVSPDNFALPQSYVQNGVLGPEGPAWKALIVESTQNLTSEWVNTIKSYAQAGLPTILVDGTPGFYPSRGGSEEAEFISSLNELINTTNVLSASKATVAKELKNLGLHPHVATELNGTVYSTWREDLSTSIDYAFIYAKGNAAFGNVTIRTIKIPYHFDAWTGDKTLIRHYENTERGIVIPLNIAANDTRIIAFSDKALDDGYAPKCSICSLPPNALGYSSSSPSSITLHLSASETPENAVLSDGTNVTIQNQGVAKAFTLSNWTLVAEHWEAPSNISNAAVLAAKRNTTHSLDALVSWLDIPALTNSSGLGFYTSTFTWPPKQSDKTSGAYIALPHIQHTAKLYVNGKKTPAINMFNPTIDVSKYLQDGVNEVLIVVPTTMWNYIRSILGEIWNSGKAPLIRTLWDAWGPALGLSDNGLIGEVRVIPYSAEKVECRSG
ncbi:hypothetical protein BU24DRAFT_441866 [Aaosphaeria arxii CBS 175.79]|uniref:Glycoside hydrolase family 2 protein n=1 Tax=Aaosphaeria arxii CBS 175.79 TaxID=1450172 RepID=A0A6A5XNP7_9PLEO|nr:uncharacterized protein BU24DRAFT_441866 [Aaosphaeria arxii CBS 175.79]KAF2014360.1 hypothetical protein BU24DRAFT_441866 [Aaosphaeria arxii CBS 175.79]